MTRTCKFSVSVLILFLSLPALAQTDQVGAEKGSSGSDLLEVDYVGFRPAVWETEKVTEVANERPNQGGWVTVYFTNRSDSPVPLAFYRLNGEDESTWRLGGFLAWDRLSVDSVEPGQTAVLEICGVTRDFSEGARFDFSWVGRETWRPVGRIGTHLKEDTVQVSLIRFLPGLKEAEIHLRQRGTGKAKVTKAEILGASASQCRIVGDQLDGPDRAIVRLSYDQPLPLLSNAIVRVEVEEAGERRRVYSHRRVFEDTFPIGTWGIEEGQEALYRQHHIDTCIQGGNAALPFFQGVAERFGFRALVHTGVVPSVDAIRGLADSSSVLAWLIHDEPDWSMTSQRMLLSEEITRHYNRTKPTFITLSRNVKFFEYAQIPDIPCHDHYCVGAPSSSRWPTRYGTFVEETGYYTRDLKRASEPKPIWVWSQGVHEWDRRPERELPTPDELASQLWLNIGNGAKGILWFTFDLAMGRKYPDSRQAVRDCGRVLRLMREDLLGAEPYDTPTQAPDKVEVDILAAWDKVFVLLTHQDYEFRPEGYRWNTLKDVLVRFDLPDWISPNSVVELSPSGVEPIEVGIHEGHVKLELDELRVCRIFELANDGNQLLHRREAYQGILDDEQREW